MRRTRAALPLAIGAAAIALALVMLAAFSVEAVGRGGFGGWGMGTGIRDHMSRMMGGGTDASNAPVSVGGAAASVAIRGFAFSPGNLQVPGGAKVTWTNDESAPHTATAKDGSWDTGMLNQGQSATLTFDRPGDYTYDCKVHPNMVARPHRALT
ncbi:MAG: cupredoxin family copper-binding protein [Chloroflexota bacterium]|nr:cupredoxin family copper-binding protein [Chloroflexota bacterium]